jgi:hypothetical protein
MSKLDNLKYFVAGVLTKDVIGGFKDFEDAQVFLYHRANPALWEIWDRKRLERETSCN